MRKRRSEMVRMDDHWAGVQLAWAAASRFSSSCKSFVFITTDDNHIMQRQELQGHAYAKTLF